MNKRIKNNGITLISLVITIIIMLILVGVSITLAVNGGLFEYAGNAVGDTKNSMKNEQTTINEIIDYYVKPNAGEKVHNWTRTGDTFTCSHCNKTYTMGQEVEYIAKGATSTTLTAQMSGLDKYKEQNSSYPEGSNTGTDGTQIVETQTNIKWVVLGIDKKTESLLITTSEPLYRTGENGLCFFGAATYNNGPSEINRICRELYSNSEYGYARGMTIEDVNDVFNFTPLGGVYKVEDDNGIEYYTTGNYTTKFKDINENALWEKMKKTGYYTPDGETTETTCGEWELDGYIYYLSEDGKSLSNMVETDKQWEITDIEKNMIFSEGINYWLATRGTSVDVYGICEGESHSGSAYVNYGMGTVSTTNKNVRSWGASYTNQKGGSRIWKYKYRPVVTCTGKLPELKGLE